jgi:hypothetical protein
MWLTGGWDDTDVRNDVWYSTDGANWVCATDSAEWPSRSSHIVVAMGARLWLNGGFLDSNGTIFAEDVWYSSGLGIEETKSAESGAMNRDASIVGGALFLPQALGHKPQTASLLDISGRKVMGLQPGRNDARTLAPGVYFVRRASGAERDASSVTKVIVTR